MSLLSYITQEEQGRTPGFSAQDRLRQALYGRLSSEDIATLAQADPQRARREVMAVLEMQLATPAFAYMDKAEAACTLRDVADMVLGFGPIERLLEDPQISEVMVNAPDEVFYEQEGKLFKSDVSFAGEQQVRQVIDRILAPLGRRVDEQSPFVSARLPQGHRVNVVIPPLAINGTALTIRKFRERVFTLEELVSWGSMDAFMATLLSWAVKARKNIAVSGGTGGGKTTLLNALSCEIAQDERIITIEDSAELKFEQHPNLVRLEARSKNSEGSGEVTIRELVINALRMRPDRIVVGECRGGEALDMLQAMNTGHDGSMTTLHANSPTEVVPRLIMMARYAMDLPVAVLEEQIASAIDLIVQQDRFADGVRRVTAIVSCSRGDTGVVLRPLLVWDKHRKRYECKGVPDWVDDIAFAGIATESEVETWCCQLESL